MLRIMLNITLEKKRNERKRVSDVQSTSHELFKYLKMFNKIIIYGDSLSNTESCQTIDEHMWYRYVFPEYSSDKFINRSKLGNSVGTMFLQAGHDCLTHVDPIMIVVALGPLQRLPAYTDGWYDKEILTNINSNSTAEQYPLPPKPTGLQDCQPYFDSYSSQKVSMDTVNLFHPTLLWSTMYDQVNKLNALVEKHNHSMLVVHMSHLKKEYNLKHPLISPLENAAMNCNYINEDHSCNNVCKNVGIKPWDFDEYGYHGHHSKEGQEYFGKYIKKIWN
jgi:hypothetical protein